MSARRGESSFTMGGLFRLTLRYLTFHKVKSLILMACLTITISLPLTLHQLIRHYEDELGERARKTPLIIGAKGDRFDLTLTSLYFQGEAPEPITAQQIDELRETNRANVYPLFLGYSARKQPLVGTSNDYFRFRGLGPSSGTLPLRLGDAVLGSEAAAKLQLSTGDSILSDQASLINVGGTYPLKMPVVGVLAPTGTPDDRAVFVDLNTTWVIAGIGHGHMDLEDEEAEGFVASREGNKTTGNAALLTYNEITPENVASFHFHAKRDELPITSIITEPKSDKDRVILNARYSVSDTTQMLVPTEIIDELMGIVFQVKRFFDASLILVLVTTVLFLALVVLLSLRIRKPERQTMFHIGCGRLTIFWLQTFELVILLVVATFLAIVFSAITIQITDSVFLKR